MTEEQKPVGPSQTVPASPAAPLEAPSPEIHVDEEPAVPITKEMPRIKARKTKVEQGAKDFVKVIKPTRNPRSGAYSYPAFFVHKDKVKEFVKR